MASPFQQQSLQRKLIYIVSIVVLLCGSFVFRRYVVEAKAADLNITEDRLGDVELTGSAVRLSLTGSRGLAVCALWVSADEKQKKNQWNELEMLVRSITKLQPHFLSPWLFQSWNLAYNVSVESIRIRDKYFFITRGIELLAEGERQNRNQPDLRDTIGFYTQNKITQSDENSTCRSLFQLSCIPPSERDPARFFQFDNQGQKSLNRPVFEEFCKQHPQLVRRLHDKLHYVKPEHIIQFLDESQKIPSLYEEKPEGALATGSEGQSKFKPVEKRFPLLPPPHTVQSPQQPYPGDYPTSDRTDVFRDDFSAYSSAYAWFAYAQEALPGIGDMPGEEEPIRDEDRTKLRRPKYTTSLFRTHPPRTQSYIAESLALEGWFDITGWLIPNSLCPRNKFSDGSVARVGKDRDWAIESWTRAYEAWRSHGETNHLLLSPEEKTDLERRGNTYRETYRLGVSQPPPGLREEDRGTDMEDSFLAYSRIHWYDHYRHMTNFPHFYYRAQLESKQQTVDARKAFFEADQEALAGNRDDAIKKYESKEALPAWVNIMLNNEDFAQDSGIQEDTYEIQLDYLKLIKQVRGQKYKQLLALPSIVGQAASTSLNPLWISGAQLGQSKSFPHPLLKGPFDVENKKGGPLIAPETVKSVNTRRGIGVTPLTSPPVPISPTQPQVPH